MATIAKVTIEAEVIVDTDALFNEQTRLWAKHSTVWFDEALSVALRHELDSFKPYGRWLGRAYGPDGDYWDKVTAFNYDGGLMRGSTSSFFNAATNQFDELEGVISQIQVRASRRIGWKL